MDSYIFKSDEYTTLWCGDATETLRRLSSESVHCVVTSPPYYGLRDYDVDGQIGLEQSPDEYIARMVDVFREVSRVLRKDGTAWVNMGDSYAGSGKGPSNSMQPEAAQLGARNSMQFASGQAPTKWISVPQGIKPKDLLGIPWMLAFALRADGWYLRQDIVWAKPNPMPESVTDRCTKAHEMLFLLAKAEWIGPSTGQFGDVSDEDARWLALLFDTEGNIVIKRAERADGQRQYGAQLAFANTSRVLLERARSVIGMGSIHERPGKNAPMYYWQLGNRQARDLLYCIYPFLIVKQRQARVAIHMQDTVLEPKRRPNRYRTEEHAAFLERCWQTVKQLNRFGNPDISWVPEPRYGRWGGDGHYFYDADAVRESAQYGRSTGGFRGEGGYTNNRSFDNATSVKGNTQGHTFEGGRNKRSVWEIATAPYAAAHFATFPPALVEPCIKAGTSERGCCPECGAPWERRVSTTPMIVRASPARAENQVADEHFRTATGGTMLEPPKRQLVGWFASCEHWNAEPVPCTVLDPFGGSGTTAAVAKHLGRRGILIELNPRYCELAVERVGIGLPTKPLEFTDWTGTTWTQPVLDFNGAPAA